MENYAVKAGKGNEDAETLQDLEEQAGSLRVRDWLAKVLTPLGVALLAFGGVFFAVGQAEGSSITQMGVTVESQSRAECMAIEEDAARDECLTGSAGAQPEIQDTRWEVTQEYWGLALSMAGIGAGLIAGGAWVAARSESRYRKLSLKHSRLVAQQRYRGETE